MLFIIHFLYYLFRIAIRIKFRLFFFSPSKKQQKYKKRKNCKKTRSRSFHKSFKIFRGRTRQKHRMPHWSIFTSLSYTLNPPLFHGSISCFSAITGHFIILWFQYSENEEIESIDDSRQTPWRSTAIPFSRCAESRCTFILRPPSRCWIDRYYFRPARDTHRIHNALPRVHRPATTSRT